MKPETIQKLLSINRQFYQTFAQDFDATRQRVQPGVARVLKRVLDGLPPDARILDLGCGNGEVARELVRQGFRGGYVGVDASEGLLDAARAGLPGEWRLEIRDLTEANWEVGLGGPFDVVLAFAVLHHLPAVFVPGILGKVRGLSPLFVLSNWQFLNSPRWRARIQPWERVGLSASDVGPNDYLLDWQRGGEGLRYVHHFDEDELASLAAKTGYTSVEQFYSDGKEGNLALYQIWEIIE